MKIENLTKLTLAALVVAQFLHAEVAHAKSPQTFIQTFKTLDAEALQDPYYQVKSFQVRELTAEEALEFSGSETPVSDTKKKHIIGNKGFVGPNIPNIPPVPPQSGNTPPPVQSTGVANNVIMIIDKIIAIGEKFIPNIKDGKPVVNNNPMSSISVLPRSEAKDQAVHDMGGWSVPVSKHYKIVYKNVFGSEVVSFVYSISYQYNGNADGKGKYLTGIRASARNVAVSWGFDVDASSQLLQISNVGTQQNVIAAATIEMTYTIKNWTMNITTSNSFHVRGDGTFYKLD